MSNLTRRIMLLASRRATALPAGVLCVKVSKVVPSASASMVARVATRINDEVRNRPE